MRMSTMRWHGGSRRWATKRIDTILDLVSRFDDVFISLSKERLDMSHRWDKQAC